MALEVWVALVLANALLFLTPGPTMLLVLATALERGGAAALVTVAGGMVGACLALLLSLLGVGALLAASTAAFTLLKVIGAGYLIYLGVRAWRAPPVALEAPRLPGLPIPELLLRGFLTALFNPKSIVFHIAFVPQFIDPTRPIVLQLAIILATFGVQLLVMDGAVALLAGRVRGSLTAPAAGRLVHRLAGSALIAAGMVTLTLRRAG